MMRKALTAAMAALMLGGAVSATAIPAQARGYDRGWHGGGYRHDNGGAVAAAGIVGLALGAALASDHGYRHSYGYGYRPYYSSYYGPDYYDGPPVYRVCESERWVWDPYIGRRVPVRTRYAC